MKLKIIFWVGLVCFSSPLWAQDTRDKSLDFIILLDKSLSMDDKIDAVKTFFRREILEKQIKPGDSVLLITFYGKVEVLLDMAITSEIEITKISATLNTVKADGPYTDIGSAIDFTSQYVEKNPRRGKRQHFILLTDGIQESPPGSPYAGPKGYLSHPFLENAKTIAQSGWKIQILGIGSQTEASALADELSGSAKVWEDSQSMLRETEIDFFEDLRLTEPAKLTYLSGAPHLSLTVNAENLQKTRLLKMDKIFFLSESIPDKLVLGNNFFMEITKNGTYTLQIPIEPEAISQISGKSGEILINFSGDLALSPGRFMANFPMTEDGSWWIPSLLALAFCGLCFIIVLLIRKNRFVPENEERIVPKKP